MAASNSAGKRTGNHLNPRTVCPCLSKVLRIAGGDERSARNCVGSKVTVVFSDNGQPRTIELPEDRNDALQNTAQSGQRDITIDNPGCVTTIAHVEISPSLRRPFERSKQR